MAKSSEKTIPFEKHPLYQEALDQIMAGDKEAAVATLERLRERYPDEQFLQDLLVRVQLQTTFGDGAYIPTEHSQGTPILRTVVMMMLALTTCLVIAAGLFGLYFNVIVPQREAEAAADTINSKWDEVDWRLEAGDLSGVRQVLEELATLTPEDPKVQEALADVDWLKWCKDLYADGTSQLDTEAAQNILYQIPPECPNYAQAQKRIAELKRLGTKETAWVEAQGFFQAEDWQSAITTLTWIREQDQEFQQPQVDNLLFECHIRVARQLIDNARGEIEAVRSAASHLQEALALKPADQDLRIEYSLAVGYVAGYEAYDRGDWSVAVERWEPLYALRSDYQNGALREMLLATYPLAAQQLIADAKGSIMRLTLAIDYLDVALQLDPTNEALQQERELAAEYLAGNDAYVRLDVDLAIAHWGPIYILRPEYQNGTLREKLREACSQSTSPDEVYCAP